MRKKSLLISLSLLVVLLFGSGVIYTIKHNKEMKIEKIYTEKINDQVTIIKKSLMSIKKENDTAKKLVKLKAVEDNFEDYKNGKERDSKVIKAYTKTINNSKIIFTTQNKKVLKDNSITNINEETQETLKVKSENLEKLLNVIDSQLTIVYSKKKQLSIKEKISNLLKSYQSKILELTNKANEEKKETERLAQVELEKQSEREKQEYNNNGSNIDQNSSYQSSPQPSTASESQSPTPNSEPNTGNQYDPYWNGWSAGANGENKHNTHISNNNDGTWTVDPGNGNGNSGGWSIN